MQSDGSCAEYNYNSIAPLDYIRVSSIKKFVANRNLPSPVSPVFIRGLLSLRRK